MDVGAVGIIRSVLGVFVGRQETGGHSLELRRDIKAKYRN